MRCLILFFSYVSFCFLGCSGLEEAERERLRKANGRFDIIYRLNHEEEFPLTTPKHRIRKIYPWENQMIGNQWKITKEFFRCKGNSLSPLKTSLNHLQQTIYLFDCGGSETHSLPIKGNEEFIYPILIDLLNYVQFRTKKRVIITCGHRCPIHNKYADSSTKNETSKHQMGAEVDFYVEDFEQDSLKILDILFDYYKQNPAYQGDKQFTTFERYEKETDVSTKPWYNKEVFIKLYRKHEGRDLDNKHPYPYISIQVRYDRDEKKPVIYNWHLAFNSYKRI